MAIGLYDKDRNIFWNLARVLCIALFGLVVTIICILIRLVTLTTFDGHKITRFKVWRIRKLTGLKLWFFYNFPDVCRMLDLYSYMVLLNKKVGRRRI